MKAHGHLFLFFHNMPYSYLKLQPSVTVYNSVSFSLDATLSPYQYIIVWIYCYFHYFLSAFTLPRVKMYIYIIHICSHDINTYTLLVSGHIYTYLGNEFVFISNLKFLILSQNPWNIWPHVIIKKLFVIFCANHTTS